MASFTAAADGIRSPIVSGRKPKEIWEDGLDEGHRRLERRPSGLLATGALGGLDVMLGILALVLTTAALETVLNEELAHVLASTTFGLGFAFIVIGRSELFTENFLIPVTAALAGRERPSRLARLWALTFAGNLAALAALASVLAVDGVFDSSSVLSVAGELSDTFGRREFAPALASAIVAGIIMTLFTWLVLAAERDSTRVVLALLVGFLLAAPSLNHAVVGFGEMFFGLVAGTAEVRWIDLVQNLGVATLGNLIGGLGVITATRLLQVSGEEGGGEEA